METLPDGSALDPEKSKDKEMFTELLTVVKAAQVMAVSPSYLYKLVRTKQLPAVKIGTSVRIRPGVSLRGL